MPVVFPSKDTDGVVSAFLSDVHSRMPCICGSGIKFSNKPLILCASLHPATAISQHPNARPAPVKPTLQRIQSATGLLKSGGQAQAYPQTGLETDAAAAQVVPSLSLAHVLPRAASNPVVSSTGISAPSKGQSTSSGVPVLESHAPGQQQGDSHLPHKAAVVGRPSVAAVVPSFGQKQAISIQLVPTQSSSQTLTCEN